MQVLHANYHSEEFELGHVDGLNVAFAFTKYDNEVERTLDPSYGELKMRSLVWGSNDDGSVYSSEEDLD